MHGFAGAVLLGSCRSVRGLGGRGEGTSGAELQNEGTSQAGFSLAGEDVTTAYVFSQRDERWANIKAVLKCHLANEEGDLWAKIFHPCSPFSLKLGFCKEFALCVLCLGGACAFHNFDSIRVVISFKARTKANIINTLAMSKPFKQLLLKVRDCYVERHHIYFSSSSL